MTLDKAYPKYKHSHLWTKRMAPSFIFVLYFSVFGLMIANCNADAYLEDDEYPSKRSTDWLIRQYLKRQRSSSNADQSASELINRYRNIKRGKYAKCLHSPLSCFVGSRREKP
uniref:Uncharacterized protein n=1 Tax=Romanomermis culicivorax TaxID=13658 RepID=A0A915K3Q9_ROMCU